MSTTGWAPLMTPWPLRSWLQRSFRTRPGPEPEIAMACAVAVYTASARGDWVTREATFCYPARAIPSAPKFERASRTAADWSWPSPSTTRSTWCRRTRLRCGRRRARAVLFPFGPVMAKALWRNRSWTRPPTGSLPMKPRPANSAGSRRWWAHARPGLLEADRHDTATARMPSTRRARSPSGFPSTRGSPVHGRPRRRPRQARRRAAAVGQVTKDAPCSSR